MRQYKRIKSDYPDSILMFRLGDFYEMFFEDAHIASRILGIALTSRNKNSASSVPLCGVPIHSAESYITRLIEAGYKVAICEQVEDPRKSTGIVERRVTRVLTPGAVLDTERLDSKSGNYVASLFRDRSGFGIAYADVSTGEFRTTVVQTLSDVGSELLRIEPKEILLREGLKEELKEVLPSLGSPLITVLEPWVWDYESARGVLLSHFGTLTLDAFGVERHPSSVVASGAIVYYLEKTQMDDLPRLSDLAYYDRTQYLVMDDFTVANLELTRSLRGGGREGTLLWVLDKTLTPMGGRLLKQWILFPLVDVEKIRIRQDATAELVENPSLRAAIRKALKGVSDLERLIGRICTSYAKPQDLAALRDSVHFIKAIKNMGKGASSSLLEVVIEQIDDLSDLALLLEGAIVESPPPSLRAGFVIKEGFSSELDELRAIRRDGRKLIAELEARERQRTGIGSLKVGYNAVFGYYIEVTRPNLHLVPQDYTRRQTLSGAERFVTAELKELEAKILGAEERIEELERELFEEIRKRVAGCAQRIRRTAAHIATLDVLCSFAETAEAYGYARPAVDDSSTLVLKESRHPVVERMELGERFVPNDVCLDSHTSQLLIITGPNMAGKSTLMRQVALTVIMAQMGSFIPAQSGRIGIVDKIFTRVGASDDLARGRSTFMVEMVETAYILRQATPRSLVIFDEIGRGTSTFDGMSLAWAIAEYMYKLGARTLFATHYHELSELAVSRKRIKNYNVYVKQDGEKIVFARKLVPGASSHSYGIDVARLAGVPEDVIKGAKAILGRLERSHTKLAGSMTGGQIGLFESLGDCSTEEMVKTEAEDSVIREILSLDLDSITPLDAMLKLSQFKERLSS